MSDHKSVQEAEVAAAGKTAEAIEALRRLIMHRGEDTPKSDAEIALRESFYRAYRENGVDKATAQAAAKDAALGLGAKDSPAISKAEAQAVSQAQTIAQEYREVTETIANPQTTPEDRHIAIARGAEIEQALGIHNKPIEIKAQTINGLDPQRAAQNQQTENNPLSVKRKALSPEQETLKADYQTKLERGGVSPQTAEPASYDLAMGKGANDSRYVATAQQELQRHQLLKSLYQGVYEKRGISPEVAAIAADQLARGNGANRSPDVRRAHEQALNNISYAQQIASRQTRQPIPASGNGLESATAVQAEQPKNQRAGQQQTAADQIWAQFSLGENGVYATMAQGNPAMQRLSDLVVARDALLAGHAPVDVQKAISQNSAYAHTLEYPRDYARTIVKKAEASPEVKEKRAREKDQSTGQKATPSSKEAQKAQAQSPVKGMSQKKAKNRDRGMSY